MIDCNAVRVSIRGADNVEEYWSGLQVGNWVFTTALPFLPCLTHEQKAHITRSAHISSLCSCLEDINVLVLAQKHDSNPSLLKKIRLPATIKYIWKSDIIEKEFKTIYPQSSLATTISHDESHMDLRDSCYFLAIHILGQPESNISEAINCLTSFCMPPHSIKIGLPITVVSTPFGLTKFHNSWSSGIISNMIGTNKSIIIADVRLAPSCEGAPIFRLNAKEAEVVGIVLTSLITSTNEYSGYSYGSTIIEIANSISKILYTTERPSPLERLSINACINKEEEPKTNWETLLELTGVLESIAVIKFPESWGTGVVVGNGFVITASHVIKFGQFRAQDMVLHLSDKKYKPNIVFATSRENPIDLAVLSFNPDGADCKSIKISSTPAQLGENVLAIGYSTYIPSKPNVSAGMVSNISPLSTTCLVQHGMSGGALIRSDGTLIGIIQSVLKAKHLYPNFNLSISSAIFGIPFEKYIQHQDSELFHREVKENAVQLLHGSKL